MGPWTMGNAPYTVKCYDAKYDEENEMLVILGVFQNTNEPKIIHFHRSDFTFKGQKVVPHEEMHKTAKMFIGKPFKIVIDNDPNTVEIDQENQEEYVQMFRDRLAKEMTEVQEGMQDEKRILQRYIGELAEKEKQKKIPSVDEMLQEEANVRRKLPWEDK